MSKPMSDERRDRIKTNFLVPCPKCEGAGYIGDKMCLCCVEQSKGWSPGQVPYSKVLEILKTRGEEIERLKDEQCDACASNHHEMENLKEENSKLRELLEEIYLFAPLSKIRALLDGEKS